MGLSRADVKKVASLARLSITDEEAELRRPATKNVIAFRPYSATDYAIFLEPLSHMKSSHVDYAEIRGATF
jgi:Asp-tRNA(Asn)/Glu-tRNA(Gln) amidotransferase C subunit